MAMPPTPPPPPAEEALYDSDQTGLVQRTFTAVGTGVAFWAMAVFARWGLHPGADLYALWIPRVIGGVVAVALLVAAFTSRVVRRVGLDAPAGTLRLYRDPGTVDTVALSALASATSQPARGGWSRDPSEHLVLTFRNGTVHRYTLPDDADTPGIVADLAKALALTAPPGA